MPDTSYYPTIGKPFTELIEVESTNNYAMRQVQTNAAKHGAAWFAHHQTKGKGRMGKQWKDEPGQNIILSVVLNTTSLLLSNQFILSTGIALAVHDLFLSYAKDEVKIKWPNDIYWRDRKAAGILIENVIRGNNWQWAIAGIGANINQTKFDESLVNPVSLKQITGINYDPVALAKELCNFLENRWQQLISNDDKKLLQQYNDVLYKKNEEVQLRKNGALFNCHIKDVNAFGQLEVENAMQDAFEFGEVEWVLK